MFAIQSGVRMYGAVRKAYIDGTVDRPLNLPLVRGATLDVKSARRWFRTDEVGMQVAARPEHERIRILITKDELSAQEQAELIQVYIILYDEYAAEDFEGHERSRITGAELSAMLQIRQWSKMAPADHVSPLQTVAGTLVNITVDYFVQTPGAVNEKRPEGRALLTFLKTIDSTDFANSSVTDVAEDLCLAVLDSVSGNPELFSSGDNEQLFIKNVTSALAVSARDLLASDAPSVKKNNAATWLQLVARSLLKGGADTVLSNPVLFLGVRAGAEENAVHTVGKTLADLVITDDGTAFRNLVSADGLNAVVKSALSAIATNPSILKTDNAGLKKVITEIAIVVAAQTNPVSKDCFPELVHLILEKSAENLELLWAGDSSDPKHNLLITASREILKALAENSDGNWRPDLSKNELLDVAETLFTSVIDNPDWLTEDLAGDNNVIRTTLDAAFASLKIRDGRRLSRETLVFALKAAVKSVSLQLPLLEKLSAPGRDQGKAALTAALDAVFDPLFDPAVDTAAKWRLSANSVLQMMVQAVLEELPKKAITQDNIEAVRAVLDELIAGTMQVEQLPQALETRLAA